MQSFKRNERTDPPSHQRRSPNLPIAAQTLSRGRRAAFHALPREFDIPDPAIMEAYEIGKLIQKSATHLNLIEKNPHTISEKLRILKPCQQLCIPIPYGRLCRWQLSEVISPHSGKPLIRDRLHKVWNMAPTGA